MFLVGDDLQPIVLADPVGQNGVVIEDGHRIAGLDVVVHGGRVGKRLDREFELILDGVGKRLALAAALGGDGFACQIGVGLDGLVIFGHRHLDAGVKVGCGEIEDFLALIRDGHAGNDACHLVRLQSLQRGIKAEGLDVNLKALLLGNGPQ